jgi:hypothetical protein
MSYFSRKNNENGFNEECYERLTFTIGLAVGSFLTAIIYIILIGGK